MKCDVTQYKGFVWVLENVNFDLEDNILIIFRNAYIPPLLTNADIHFWDNQQFCDFGSYSQIKHLFLFSGLLFLTSQALKRGKNTSTPTV